MDALSAPGRVSHPLRPPASEHSHIEKITNGLGLLTVLCFLDGAFNGDIPVLSIRTIEGNP